MKIREFFITLIVLLGLFVFLADWQVCFPFGCDYSLQNQMCQDGGCVNEDVNAHLQEKGQNVSVGMDDALALFYLAIFSASFLFLRGKTQLFEHRRSSGLILKHYFFDYNPFDLLFARGILNPKVF